MSHFIGSVFDLAAAMPRNAIHSINSIYKYCVLSKTNTRRLQFKLHEFECQYRFDRKLKVSHLQMLHIHSIYQKDLIQLEACHLKSLWKAVRNVRKMRYSFHLLEILSRVSSKIEGT